MSRSIPNAIQSPLKCKALVIHALYPFEALDHDLAGFTKGRNFFPRSSSVIDINGKEKLDGEEDATPRGCANSGPDIKGDE